MLQGEHWYGFAVNDGVKFPLSAKSEYSLNLDPNPTCNQSVPLLLSSKGRYIWSPKGFYLKVKEGVILCESLKSEIELVEGHKSLKGAFQNAQKEHFPANGVTPPEEFFKQPQYNTWIELIYDQNQIDVLKYAQGILDNGFPPGILMIDDGWSEFYGRWEFNKHNFPDPKEMIEQLHQMGFKVMLWTCPFISPDSLEMRKLHEKGLLVREVNGEPAVRKWWNGYSAVLDFTNPKSVEWFDGQLKNLTDKYKVDGFKFDAGDGIYYKDDDVTFAPVDANGQTALWAEFGVQYPYNEYRACFCCGGLPLVQRLADKSHSWNHNGMLALIPNQLAQGIMGYPFTCPDMIGGGEYENFLANSHSLDEELFVRYAQCAALLPMLQFSAAPWRVLSREHNQLCLEAAELHCEYSSYIYDLAKQASVKGEPIARYMEYEFPGVGLETVTDQFMLGDKILVAPVCTKGALKRSVHLPEGKWRYIDGTIYEKGMVEVETPISVLPYFVRL